ncbi:MAG: hypothetical protein ACYTGL_04340 [Planctomycetota bacterium]|jgi:hypothetical protein
MPVSARSIFTTALIATLTITMAVAPAMSCPFCSAPSLTLAEQLAQADAAVLVQWADGTKPTEKSAGSTVYEIKQIVRNHKSTLKVGERITLPRYRASKIGDLFMLMGSKGTVIEWGSPLEVSEASFNYIALAPAPETPTAKRLAYYLKFLEYPDSLVANDAYGEFANAPYEDITQLADQMPREKIRKWATSPDTPATRLGLYGLLIGLCGNDDDATAIEKRIVEETEDFRLGIDGMMSGYLLLRGNDGLEVIEKTKLKNASVPFSETYAAMQALRFMWKYAEGRIEPERLRQSMRILLDRPELADLVIADLARWNDWAVQDRLMALYRRTQEPAKKTADGDETPDPYNIPSVKRAIVRYMLVSSKDAPEDVAGQETELPEHVAKGRKYVDELRKLDPKTVQQAERFFFLK